MFQVGFAAPTDGEAPSFPPDQLGGGQALGLRNFLVDNPGRVQARGHIGDPSATGFGTAIDTVNGGTMIAAVPFQDIIFNTFRMPAAGPLVDNWRVPINRPQAAGDLAQPSLRGNEIDMKTGVVTGVTVGGATSVFGPSVVNVDSAIYSASFGGASTAVPTGVAPLNAIRKGDGAGSAVVLTNGPRFVQSIFSHGDRLWAAAARTPGGADYDTSKIFYTNPGGTTAFTDVATDWQDPVTGESNEFVIGASNDGDFVVGFGRAAGQLVVFKRNAVFVLYGTSPSNYTLRQVRQYTGCVDFRSIVVSEEGTYFASQLGYELFDGTTFKKLSNPVEEIWNPLALAGVCSGSVNHAYVVASPLPNNYLYVALGTDATTANATDGTSHGWLLYRPTGAWIELTTAISTMKLGAGGYINRFVMTTSTVTAWGAGKWARCDAMVYGPTAGIGVVDKDTSSRFSVDLKLTTRLDNMGSYRHLDGKWIVNNLMMLQADYHHHYVTTTPPADNAIFATLSAIDSSGAQLVSPIDLEGHTPPGPLRVRPIKSGMWESNRGDVALVFESNIGVTATLCTERLDLYGLGVGYEHQNARYRDVA